MARCSLSVVLAVLVSAAEATMPPSELAVCLVGQLRSVGMTAPSLRAYLLDAWEADGFLIATTDDGTMPSAAERAAAASLGPRLIRSVLNATDKVLNTTLLNALTDAPIHESNHLHRLDPDASWPRRMAGQVLHNKACNDEVMAHEKARGLPYKIFARVRVDTYLFHPVPIGFRMAAASSANVAVVPLGADYGSEPHPGLNDRMLVGGREAFTADAKLWHVMLQNTPAVSHKWVVESLLRDQLSRSGIRVVRQPLAFCLMLKETRGCKYPEELIRSLDLLEGQETQIVDAGRYYHALLDSLPTLCGPLGQQPCTPSRSTYPQTLEMARRDPGFCNMAATCSWARQRAMKVPPAAFEDESSARDTHCLADGSVVEDGVRLPVTLPCDWDTPAPAAVGHTCEARELLTKIRASAINRSSIELVVVR